MQHIYILMALLIGKIDTFGVWIKKQMHSQHVTVSCGFQVGRIFGPNIFENETGQAVTVNSARSVVQLFEVPKVYVDKSTSTRALKEEIQSSMKFMRIYVKWSWKISTNTCPMCYTINNPILRSLYFNKIITIKI